MLCTFHFQYRAKLEYLCGCVSSTSMTIVDAYIINGHAFFCQYMNESILEHCCGAPLQCRHVWNVLFCVNVIFVLQFDTRFCYIVVRVYRVCPMYICQTPYLMSIDIEKYCTWKAGSAFLCQIIYKSSKYGGRHFQK